MRGLLAPALALVLSMAQGMASAGWAFIEAGHQPLSPDHEETVTFTARLALFSDTNASEGGGAGNGTGNQTGGGGNESFAPANLTGVLLLIGPENATACLEMTPVSRDNLSAEFSLSLSPLSPGAELPYRFEAILSNGSSVSSNASWLRTPDITTIKWHRNMSRALELALSLGRPLLLLVYDDMDGSLRELEEGPLRDPDVLELSARFVCVRMSRLEDPALAPAYGLGSLPGIVFINASTGETLGRLTGVPSGAELASRMQLASGLAHPSPEPAIRALDYRLLFLALSLTLVIGLGALWAGLARKRKA
ncbi:MAG: hypothetical protein ACUVV6_08280 [Thermoplasmatota archaeon]